MVKKALAFSEIDVKFDGSVSFEIEDCDGKSM